MAPYINLQAHSVVMPSSQTSKAAPTPLPSSPLLAEQYPQKANVSRQRRHSLFKERWLFEWAHRDMAQKVLSGMYRASVASWGDGGRRRQRRRLHLHQRSPNHSYDTSLFFRAGILERGRERRSKGRKMKRRGNGEEDRGRGRGKGGVCSKSTKCCSIRADQEETKARQQQGFTPDTKAQRQRLCSPAKLENHTSFQWSCVEPHPQSR
ncbi:hypothetical protein Q8A73_021853 [Channa argus]|nr:hypothetical protein Q8A73_021853 [Channa argus]